MNQAQLELKIITEIEKFRLGYIDHYKNLKDRIREIIKEHFEEVQEK